MEAKRLESLKQIAAGIAAQFGDKCEVVIHDVASSHPEHTIVHIENGHVSGRKIGDGASRVVMEQLEHQNEQPQDHLCYLTRTPGGKILKSSSLYIRNSRGAVTAIFSINYDITNIMMMHQELGEFTVISSPSGVDRPRSIQYNRNDKTPKKYRRALPAFGSPKEPSHGKQTYCGENRHLHPGPPLRPAEHPAGGGTVQQRCGSADV